MLLWQALPILIQQIAQMQEKPPLWVLPVGLVIVAAVVALGVYLTRTRNPR